MHNDIKQYNIGIFENTMDVIKKDSALVESINKSIKNQLFYLNPVDIKSIMPQHDTDCPVTVTRERSIECAMKWVKRDAAGTKVAVLNFASATQPGGGVATGSSAQEECICRCTTLYPCLTTKEAEVRFYDPHRKNVGPLHNDDIIYTPDVAIIKNDDYDLLREPLFIDVITCAAPNLREKNVSKYNQEREPAPDISPEELKALHVARARQILNAAVQNFVDVLVLGAFGCGAFRNDPEVVAAAYKEVLPEYRKYFKAIEFAVYCRGKDTENYEAFKKELA
jgi:uncharacterized protein (TIGR02452 family)